MDLDSEWYAEAFHMPEWDIFISHAAEDKETLARPLARLLEEQGFAFGWMRMS
jgi:hypothetical protein